MPLIRLATAPLVGDVAPPGTLRGSCRSFGSALRRGPGARCAPWRTWAPCSGRTSPRPRRC
eukprot:4200016-Pyramimonas_sp.AAC.1